MSTPRPWTRARLGETIDASPLLSQILAAVIVRLDGDAAHDLEHLKRVALWTLRCGPELDPEAAIAAALLHDIVNVPKDSAQRAQASELCAAEAAGLLAEISRSLGAAASPAAHPFPATVAGDPGPDPHSAPRIEGGLGFTPHVIADIAQAIRDHSFSRGATPESALGRALQDADRLEAVGAIGLMRCIATGPRLGAALFDAEDPWAEQRDLADTRFSLDHLFTKLLKLAPTLLTPVGRQEAARRTRVLEQFIAALGEELERPPPPGPYY